MSFRLTLALTDLKVYTRRLTINLIIAKANMEIPKEPLKLEDNVALWAEFKELTTKYECISLGEGAPEYQPFRQLRGELIQAIDEGHNQYIRTFGH